MAVLSQTSAKYDVISVIDADLDQLIEVWENCSRPKHWCNPWSLMGDNAIYLLEIFVENKLVAYFPFNVRKFNRTKIIRPANYELTLDFIDLCVKKDFEEIAKERFVQWLLDQKNSALDIFMCSEESLIVDACKNIETILIMKRGIYYSSRLKSSLDEFIMGLSRSPRADARKVLKRYEDHLSLQIVHKENEEVLLDAYTELVNLHENLFKSSSAFLPHMEKMKKFIIDTSNKEIFIFFQAKDGTKVVATNLMVISNKTIGLIQVGRLDNNSYNKVGTWLLIKSIEWAIENDFKKIEYFFGDQEYKRRFSNSKKDAVSIQYFSSVFNKYMYRIFQRLGKYFKTLR
ncbi:MAG: GNAT family N-acetyltransferase [Acidimicrobiia bacterium]